MQLMLILGKLNKNLSDFNCIYLTGTALFFLYTAISMDKD